MHALFEEHGVTLLAISKDRVAEVRHHIDRDGLSHVRLLSDPQLEVIAQYGLEHHKALEFKTWTVLGLPLGVPAGKKRMAIPTTLLVDEQGIVRWIDQADDYRIRGDDERIRRALRVHLS